jgi:tetratricopeptide (TPR) repeat protein
MAIKNTRTKTKVRSKTVAKKQTTSHKKTKLKPASHKASSKAAKPIRRRPAEDVIITETPKSIITSSLEEQPHLLRNTKSTAAALSFLERAIKLIYNKEFKKARAELKGLFEGHQAEPEILARARMYQQICDREEGAHKKPIIANDQLYNMGVMEHNRGDYDKAIQYFRQSLEKNPNSDHIYYSLAASFAIKGDAAEAVKHLQKAVELNEENRVYAKNDSDFSPLHGKKEFSDLVGWNQPLSGG